MTNFIVIIGAICILIICYTIVYLLRKHGIDSCVDRGGIPITRSWLNKSAWDVSCIRLQK